MAYLTEISTSTLNNQNISAALLVHTFTNTTRLRKVWIDVFLDQVAGGVGSYTIYVTRQLSGAGSFYESMRAEKPAASGVTAIMFNSLALTLGATDVVRVYVIGLAADTATPDILTKVNEEWVAVDASGVVDANLVQILATAITETAGQIAAAFKQFFDVASPTGTMKAITSVATATNLTNAPTNGDLTATMKTSVTTASDAVAIKTDTAAILIDTGTTLDGRIPAALTGGKMESNIGAVTAGIIAAASFAAGALDAVWSTAARLLTAGTNIVLAKGTGVTGFTDITAAQVNTEVVDALNVDTYTEPGQGAPAMTATLAAKINYLYKSWRNKKTQTMTMRSLFADDGVTVDQKATDSDDVTTFTKGEIGSGP